jgi:hypothetical protein
MGESNSLNTIATQGTHQAEAALAEMNPESFSPKHLKPLSAPLAGLSQNW